MKFKPYPYQVKAVEHLLKTPYAALWMGMGLGKSSVTLTALAELFDTLQIRRVLVVAPLRVAKLVWPAEVAKWDHTKHLTVQLIHGTPEQRHQQIRTDAAIHIVNFDLAKWLVQEYANRWPWDCVVVDEASKLKSAASWRWKALKHVRPKIKRLIELTGTPATAGLTGLWAQIYLLDEGKRLFKTKGMFHRRWFEQVDRDGRQWRPVEGALEEVTERLRDIVLCLRAEDHLGVDRPIVRDVFVELPERCKADYRKLQREMFLTLEDGAIDAPNAAATSNKCLQYANGAVYVEEDEDMPPAKKRWSLIHKEKLAALDSVIGEAEGEPIIVTYKFRHDLERLRKAYPEGVVFSEDDTAEQRWNAGEIQLLFVHPQSAGHGLNLQYGGRMICFFGLTWSLEEYEQVIERIGPVRQLQAGTPRAVFVYRIVARDTVDELVTQRLDTHASVQDVLRQAMTRRVK